MGELEALEKQPNIFLSIFLSLHFAIFFKHLFPFLHCSEWAFPFHTVGQLRTRHPSSRFLDPSVPYSRSVSST